MPDVFSVDKRSEVMAKIRSKNTKPEMRLRRALHRLGYRYKIHDTTLPGKPDIVLPKYKTLIQVRGCFWHGHTCNDGHLPKSNSPYWVEKLQRNKRRDRRNDRLARQLGWTVITVWECRCSSEKRLEHELRRIRIHLERREAAAKRGSF